MLRNLVSGLFLTFIAVAAGCELGGRTQVELARTRDELAATKAEVAALKAKIMDREYDIELPKVEDAEPLISSPELVVAIRGDGTAEIDGEPQTESQLQQTLEDVRQNDTSRHVLIRGTPDVAFRHVAHVMGLCEQAGLDYRIAVRGDE